MKTVINNRDGTETFVCVEDGNLITGTGSYVANAIAEDAKARHKEGMHGSADIKHAARVDPVFIEAYLNRNGITFAEFSRSQHHMRLFLSDPALSDFRIWKGKI